MPQPPEVFRQSVPAPRWIRTPDALRRLVNHLGSAAAIAIDTESDSLHSYPEKVCLVQLGVEPGEVFLLDPLDVRDLSSLAPLCADPGPTKVFHGASYDLASLKRDFGLAFAGIFDTMIAGQFLGLPALGLDALLERYLGITPTASRQKDDWAVRPLSPEQEAYAARDVRHLLALWGRLRSELAERGRLAWVEEECEALAAMPATARVFDPDDYFGIKGARTLDRRGLAALRELYAAREAWARLSGRPPFKVLGSEVLIRLAAERPRTLQALARIPGLPRGLIRRQGDAVLAVIARGEAVPEAELPVYPKTVKPRVPIPVQRRIAALSQWRTQAAEALGIEPGILLPRRLIERLAEACPAGPQALGAIEGLRRWRIETFGRELIRALRGPGEGLPPGPRAETPEGGGSRSGYL
jgi:ribonuclease D